MRPEGLHQLNIPMTPSEIEPAQTQIPFTKFNLACEIQQITQQLSFILTEEGFVLRASERAQTDISLTAVPWLRRLDACFSLQKAVFNHGSSHAVLVVEIAAMEHAFLRALPSVSVIIILQVLQTHLHL